MKKAKKALIVEYEFERADPTKLKEFNENSKICTMNCGPCMSDPRSAKERKFLCGDCEIVGE